MGCGKKWNKRTTKTKLSRKPKYMKISVNVDRKAALLKGLFLGEKTEIEVSPETMGMQWPTLVAGLNMSTEPPFLGGYEVTENTVTELVRVMTIKADAKSAKEKEKCEKICAEINEYLAKVDTLEVAASAPMEPTQIHAFEFQPRFGGMEFSGFSRKIPVPIKIWWGVESAPAEMQEKYANATKWAAATEARSAKEVKEANLAAFQAALPALEKQLVEKEKAEKEAKEKADAVKQEANKAKFATRLETGYWERETPSYNDRREGAPWCATVSFVGAKPVYDFGESTGKWGKAGISRVACKPGDFIAFGQKDLRNSSRSEHTIQRMRNDGSMETFADQLEAVKAYRATEKEKAEAAKQEELRQRQAAKDEAARIKDEEKQEKAATRQEKQIKKSAK